MQGLKNYDIIKTIGTGSYGRVFLSKSKSNSSYYAIKALKKHDILKLKQIEHIYSEYSILKELKNNFIVNLITMLQDSKFIYFILEYVPGGELFSLLRINGSFPLSQVKFYASQITIVIEYLHSKSIILRDLKPENILINLNGYIKITDFGCSKKIDGKTYTLCGTPEYLAPEVILNRGHSKPLDWWSLGIIIYEMTVGIDPFNDEDPIVVYQKIIKGIVRFPKNIDKDVKSLIKHLLVADVSKRYGSSRNGAKDVINHRFFNSIDWKSIMEMKTEAEYIPKIKNIEDTSNFSEYPDSDNQPVLIKPYNDPFLDW